MLNGYLRPYRTKMCYAQKLIQAIMKSKYIMNVIVNLIYLNVKHR